MSGLALTAFILALLCSFAAALGGLWWLALITLVLGVWGLRSADPTRYRGRGFAIAAVVLSLLGGVIGYTGTRAFQTEVTRITTDVCRAMAAEGVDDTKRLHRINNWIHERAAEENIAEDILKRWRMLEARLGPYAEPIEPFSIFAGYFGLFAPPSEPRLHEVGDPTEGVPSLAAGAYALWSRARFEKGVVHIGFFLYGEGSSSLDFQSRLKPGVQHARLFKDIRFYMLPAP